MSRLKKNIVLWIAHKVTPVLLFAATAAAFAGNSGPLGMGVAALGRAGSVAGTARGAEALYWNPAGLNWLKHFEGTFAGGMGGPADEFHGGFSFAMPVKDYGVFGLSVENIRSLQGGPFEDRSIGVGFAIPMSERLWLGTRQRFLQVQPGELTGWAMDLGIQFKITDRITLGLSSRDLVTSLKWENGLVETLPIETSLGMGVNPWTGGIVSFQYDSIDRPDLATEGQWRAGLEQGMLNRMLTVRGGATGSESRGNYFTAGLGLVLPLGKANYRLDYAWITTSSRGLTSFAADRHLVSLSLDFAERERVQVKDIEPIVSSEPVKKKVLRDLATNTVHSAVMPLDAGKIKPKSWELHIRSADGTIVKTIKGQGLVPKALNWDGRDNLGQRVNTTKVTYTLAMKTASGKTLEKRSVLFSPETTHDEIGSLSKGSHRKFGLRETVFSESGELIGLPASGRRNEMRVRPALKGQDDITLSGATFDLDHLRGKKVKKWELKVIDSAGKTVKLFSGTGKPPKNIQWDGLTDIGQPGGSLGSRFQLRVEGDNGKVARESGEMVSARSFSRFAARDKVRIDDEKLLDFENQLLQCKLSPDKSTWTCTFRFTYGSADLGPYGRPEFTLLRQLINDGGYSEVTIVGHTDAEGSNKFNLRLSQQRAREGLTRLARKGLDQDLVDIEWYGEGRPATGNLDPLSRARNRRVDIIIKRPWVSTGKTDQAAQNR